MGTKEMDEIVAGIVLCFRRLQDCCDMLASANESWHQLQGLLGRVCTLTRRRVDISRQWDAISSVVLNLRLRLNTLGTFSIDLPNQNDLRENGSLVVKAFFTGRTSGGLG